MLFNTPVENVKGIYRPVNKRLKLLKIGVETPTKDLIRKNDNQGVTLRSGSIENTKKGR